MKRMLLRFALSVFMSLMIAGLFSGCQDRERPTVGTDSVVTSATGEVLIPATAAELTLWDTTLPALRVYDFKELARGENGQTHFLLAAKGFAYLDVFGDSRSFDYEIDRTFKRNGENFSATMDYRTYDAVYAWEDTLHYTYVDGVFYDRDYSRDRNQCPITPDELEVALEQRHTLDATGGLIPDDPALDAPFVTLPDGVAAHELFRSLTAKCDGNTTVVTGRGLNPAYAEHAMAWMKPFLTLYAFSAPEGGSIAGLLANDLPSLAEQLTEDILTVSLGFDPDGKLVSFEWRIVEFTPREAEFGNECVDIRFSVTRMEDAPTITPPENAAEYKMSTWREYFHMETAEMLGMIPDKDGIIPLSEDSILRRKQESYSTDLFPKGTRFRATGILELLDLPLVEVELLTYDREQSICIIVPDDVLAAMEGIIPGPWESVEVVFYMANVSEYVIAYHAESIRVISKDESAPEDETAAAVLDSILPGLNLYELIGMTTTPTGTVSYEMDLIGLARNGRQDGAYIYDYLNRQSVSRNQNDFVLNTDFIGRSGTYGDMAGTVENTYVNGTLFSYQDDRSGLKSAMTLDDWALVLAEEDALQFINSYRSFLPHDRKLDTPIFQAHPDVRAYRLFRTATAETDRETGITTVTVRGLAPRYATLSTEWLRQFLLSMSYDRPDSGAIAALLDQKPYDIAEALTEDVFSLQFGVDSDGNLVALTWTLNLSMGNESGETSDYEEIDLTFRLTRDFTSPVIKPPAHTSSYYDIHWRELFAMETAE